MRLKAYYIDGTEAEADVGAAAQVALEDKFDILFTDAFDDGDDGKRPAKGRMKYLYYLTWAALKNAGQDVGDDFDEWLSRVKDAGFALDQDDKPKKSAAARPTRRGPRAAASSS